MRKQRIIIAIVICAMLLTSGTFCDFVTVMASTSQIASGKCGDNLKWNIDNMGVLTISGTGRMNSWRIHQTPWENYLRNVNTVIVEEGVTSIGTYSFWQCYSLSTVQLSKGIKEIETCAFWNCENLSSLEFPMGVTKIGNSAFGRCPKLSSIFIPSSVINIGDEAFWECEGLQSIVVDEDNERYNSKDNCNAIIDSKTNELLYGCESTIIPNRVTKIGEGAFMGCDGLISIEIPTSVTSIGNLAFRDCSSLQYIKMSDNVTEIGNQAFNSCVSLKSINLSKKLKNIGELAFYNCTGLLSIDIPSSVVSIGDSAFMQCEGLKSVKFSKNLTKISQYSFERCKSLLSVEIPSGVTEIGYYAFYDCENLREVKIPASVTKICSLAFSICPNLSSITVDEYNKKYDSRNNCNAIIDTEDNALLFGSNNSVIPKGIISIEEYSFYSCNSLTNIKIPSSVEKIGECAFGYCKELKTVEFNYGLKTIEGGAFEFCDKLANIKIPSSTNKIGDRAFVYCTSLNEIEIPSSVASMGDYVFSHGSKNLCIYGKTGTYAQKYAKDNNIKFVEKGTVDISASYELMASEVDAFLDKLLKDQNYANDKIDGLSMDFTIKDNKYTFTPLNLDFAAGMPLSNLNYQAVIDTDSKTVKVLLGMSKDGKSEIKQTTDVNSTSWGQQYQSIKKMYKDLTGYDARTTRATWNNFEKMKSELNSLKCDMFVSADMKITGFLEFSFADDGSGSYFKEGGIIEKASVDTNFSSPVVAPWVYISLGLGVSEEGTLKVQMNNNVPELITSLELAAKASAKISGQIPIIAKVEGMIDAKLSANIANTEPKFTIDMSGDVTLKATALAGMIEIYNNKWNYLNCQIYPEFVNKNDYEAAKYYSTDDMLCKAISTERIDDRQSRNLKGKEFKEQNVYPNNEAKLISLGDSGELLLWIDDNNEKSDNNRTSLMYSVFDGSNWSEPTEVCRDGCFNGEFSYCIGSDGNIYIVFQKGNYIFENGTEYTQIIRNIDPYLTVFDGNSFTEPVKVREDNSSYEDNIQVKNVNDKIELTFVEYTSDYLNGASDSMSIMETINNDNKWEESLICSEDDFISDYAFADENLYVQVYNNSNGSYELHSYNNESDKVIKSLSQEVDLVSSGSELYFIDGNILTTVADGVESDSQIPYASDYKVITNGSITDVVYEVINNDKSSSIYYGQILDGKLDETTIFRIEDNYINSYDGSIDQNGVLNVAATLCTVNSDLSMSDYVLSVVGKENEQSLSTTYLCYDENEVVEGKDLSLYYDITNNGNQDISGYNIVLSDEQGNVLAENQGHTDIAIGETREEKLSYHIPNGFKEENVILQLKSMDGDTIFSKVETIIRHNDIELSDVKVTHKCNQNYVINCRVENKGYRDADNVKLRVSNYCNEIVKEYTIDNLKSGSYSSNSIELTKEEFDSMSSKDLYIDVDCTMSESDYANNTKTIDLPSIAIEASHNWVLDGQTGKYACSICHKTIEEDYACDLKGYSLSLGGNIGLNYIVQISDSMMLNKDNIFMEFMNEDGGRFERVYLNDAKEIEYNGDNCYCFQIKLNAVDMTKKITALLHCDDWIGEKYTYSIREYANEILKNDDNDDEFAKAVPLVRAMLNYGGYAQSFFREDIANLANANLYVEEDDPVQIEKVEISDNYDYPVFDSVNSFSFVGGSLVLNSGTDMKLYYSMDDENMANNINVSVNGQNVAPEYDGNIMCVRAPDISISSLGNTYNVKISVKGKEINQKYSAMTYMYKALNSQNSNTKLNNVVKALYFYNEAVKQYSMGN